MISVSRGAPNWPAMVESGKLSKGSSNASGGNLATRQFQKDSKADISIIPASESMWNRCTILRPHDEYSRTLSGKALADSRVLASSSSGRLLRQCKNCKILYRNSHTCSLSKCTQLS